MRNGGFTLVELMVVMVIVAILSAAALPFAVGWANGARQMEAKNRFTQALSVARSLALQNPEALEGDEAVSTLKITATQMQVLNTEAEAVVWRADIPRGVSVAAGGDSVSCLQFDNRGLLMSGSGCSVAEQVSFSVQYQDDLYAPTL